jgi:glycosyltransferase involved in cell wall biosynthesis
MGAGGAERVAATLCNNWSDNGHSVYLMPTFSGGGSSFYEIKKSIDFNFLFDLNPLAGKSLLNYFKRLAAIKRELKKFEPDIIISFLPNVNILTILATFPSNVPIIISERRDPFSQPMSIFWEITCRLIYRFSNAVVVQTEVVSKSIHKLYPSLKKVACIPNPLPSDLLLLKPNRKIAPRKVLLSLGRLSPEKQVDHIIRCFSKIAFESSEWDLHVYGDGPLRHDLELLTASLNLNDRILFKGRSNDPWGVMSQADAFVMTSRFEGFPNALLESMAMGLPCISYDCPSGPRDISRHGVDALLVPPQDEGQLLHQMSRLLNDEKLRQDLGQRASASVIERYKPEVILRQWDNLFMDLGLKVELE